MGEFPIAAFRTVREKDFVYAVLVVVCPGCAEDGSSGLHWLPIAPTGNQRPYWKISGTLESPTLEPSILTRSGEKVCHSYLRNGVWEFLSDSTHSFAGQKVPLPPLKEWMLDD